MGTTTHSIQINSNKYENVSNGNINCTMLVTTGQRLRLVVAESDKAPPPGGPDYIPVSGPGTSGARSSVVTITNLEAESDLWVRAEVEGTKVTVIRGAATVWLELAG